MSQKNANNKTSSDSQPVTNRHEFLKALLRSVDSELLLEFRCIQPETEKARILWARTGEQKKLSSVLRQTDTLNKSAYGIFFSPCPRTQKKGTADAAAVVPALWVDIDCDNDPERRAVSLARLHTFEPQPSIVVNSGGGWHAYWLLSEPFALESHAERQHIGNLLQGLFAAVGGDPDYAKSVASLMRLPDSINTKPERNGVTAAIIDFHPDWRYSLSAFEWLASTLGKPVLKRLDMPSDSACAPLPRATLDYLNQGAANGNRNHALFDAACQFRDAGYSQDEAEAQLIPRHIADGSSGENLTAREREARATITSVYHQPRREPLPTTSQNAQQLVHALVNQQRAAERQGQPTAEQIAEAVKACAHLDALDWATQRQKLKTLCGDGVRITDLDRQYRQARQALERERLQDYAEHEEYLEAGHKMIYRHITYRGPVERVVAAWTGTITERISQINDDGTCEHIAALQLRSEQQTFTLQVPSELFGDEPALRRFIAGHAGETFTVRAGMGKHLAPAILSLSGEYPRRTNYRFMGWAQINDRWTYIAPGVSVNADGLGGTPLETELDTRLRDYGLHDTSCETALAAFRALIPVFPKQLAPTCIAFALLPIVQRFFPAAAPRPAIHLTGTYGSGKSEIAALMSNFYGCFSRDTPPAQWGDTINTVETIGYPLADALYWVDDYKNIYADERTFTRFLQSYSRGMGRGRLTRDSRVRQERPCRGTVLSTGETVLEGEASVLSRMLVLEVPPWEHRDPGGEALLHADALRHALPGFTIRFAAWIAQQVEQHDLPSRLSHEFAISVQGYRDKLKASGITMANTGRVIQNWAVLVTVYRLLRDFLASINADDLLPSWQDAILETAQSVRQERASQIFIDLLSQLLAGGQVILDDSMQRPREASPGSTIVGYRDEAYIYLLPEIAHKEVSKIQPLHFSAVAIGMQLKEDGFLIPGANNLTVQRRVKGNRVRFWQLKMGCLGDDGNVICDTD
ncbi:MAG TPA: primase C-terminal domain-containing protein [Aggregatilinea sp.]|uniref:primase C-terminal domain-containing protein n=1 Tax=Aggregatilinea sp. TaxID=2806333 RepID=UPI002C8A6E1E|nr:primase C-terminal domain-containing protein [Aggregatilinea sp.]HML23002.1 primase C-terminal domain-containing protein [Aggregatilinea sp.]